MLLVGTIVNGVLCALNLVLGNTGVAVFNGVLAGFLFGLFLEQALSRRAQ